MYLNVWIWIDVITDLAWLRIDVITDKNSSLLKPEHPVRVYCIYTSCTKEYLKGAKTTTSRGMWRKTKRNDLTK